MGITPAHMQQQDLLLDDRVTAIGLKRERLMQIMDTLNAQLGTKTLFVAAEGTKPTWIMQANNRSPRFTSNWRELANVVA